jgi:hypothetical protein
MFSGGQAMKTSGRCEVSVQSLFLAGVLLSSLMIVPGVAAQVNGVPASVTSIGFGGNFNSHPGVPASITSIGPHGFGFNPQLFTQRSFNQPLRGNPQLFPHHPHHQGFFPGGVPVVAVPYGIPYGYPVEVPVVLQDDSRADEYDGGPTIFDRRGPGPSNRQDETRYSDGQESADPGREAAAVQPATDEAVASQPDTHIVFKDGHAVDLSNYAIIGATLYDLTPGHPRKIALSDVDVPATEKQNQDRGVDFHVPAS